MVMSMVVVALPPVLLHNSIGSRGRSTVGVPLITPVEESILRPVGNVG